MARKKMTQAPSSGGSSWMNTYADLVTLLLCFFALLFSMSTVDVEKFKAMINSFNDQIDLLPGGQSFTEGELIADGVTQLEELATYLIEGKLEDQDQSEEEYREKLQQSEAIAEDVDNFLETYNLSDKVEITYTAQYVQLSLKGAVLFDSGRAELKSEAVELMDTLSLILKKYESNKIAIEGHTDNLPINTTRFPSNWYLSSARAISVANYLIEYKAFSPENVSAVGYGEYRPVADNDSSEGRAQNRRVEIKIINTLNAE